MSEEEKSFPLRRVQSFVRRDGRLTIAQAQALKEFWPTKGLLLESGLCDFNKIFLREAPRILEIGFGSGQSLLATAAAHPESDFIGIEMHQPGIGALLLGMKLQQLTNIRVYYADAVEVLEKGIPDESLDGIQLFFPDPWPKRRHRKRRLIQAPFVNLVVTKLKKGGVLHLATDWEDYAVQMMKELSLNPKLNNLAGAECYSNRSKQRPIVTKFERRGTQEGRQIWELQFARV